jgi:hypothetical protein
MPFISNHDTCSHLQGGPNPVIILSPDASPKELKKPKKDRGGSASPRGAEILTEAEMRVGDVIELDGFKRKNFRRWVHSHMHVRAMPDIFTLTPHFCLFEGTRMALLMATSLCRSHCRRQNQSASVPMAAIYSVIRATSSTCSHEVEHDTQLQLPILSKCHREC